MQTTYRSHTGPARPGTPLKFDQLCKKLKALGGTDGNQELRADSPLGPLRLKTEPALIGIRSRRAAHRENANMIVLSSFVCKVNEMTAGIENEKTKQKVTLGLRRVWPADLIRLPEGVTDSDSNGDEAPCGLTIRMVQEINRKLNQAYPKLLAQNPILDKRPSGEKPDSKSISESTLETKVGVKMRSPTRRETLREPVKSHLGRATIFHSPFKAGVENASQGARSQRHHGYIPVGQEDSISGGEE